VGDIAVDAIAVDAIAVDDIAVDDIAVDDLAEQLIARFGGPDRLEEQVVVFVLVAARLAPLTLIAPWIALRSSPTGVRVAVTLGLAAALTPIAIASTTVVPVHALGLSLVAIRELLVGAVFAVCASVPLFGLQWAGTLLERWRGASGADIPGPTGDDAAPLGHLLLLMGIALFVALGMHRFALASFADALAAVPIGVSTIGDAPTVALGTMRLVAAALGFALSVAAPGACALLLVDVAAGFIARAAPEVGSFFSAMPLRAVATLGGLCLALAWTVDDAGTVFGTAIEAARRVVDGFANP
jgi:type III secretory pathway component EscT